MNDLTFERKLRVEALRAASRIMQGKYETLGTEAYTTIDLAEDFYRWLRGETDDG